MFELRQPDQPVQQRIGVGKRIGVLGHPRPVDLIDLGIAENDSEFLPTLVDLVMVELERPIGAHRVLRRCGSAA